MRKIFSKKIVTTTIDSSVVTMQDGVPTLTSNEPIKEMGKLSDEKKQELVTATYGLGSIVTGSFEDVKTYRFNIFDIIPYALPEETATEEVGP